MLVWLKEDSGRVLTLTEPWLPSVYLKLNTISEEKVLKIASGLISGYDHCEKIVNPSDDQQSRVLRLKVPARNLGSVALLIEENLPFNAATIFNADIPPSQAYLYERDLLPLGEVSIDHAGKQLVWKVLDDPDSYDYGTSFLRVAKMDLRGVKRLNDPLQRIDVTCGDQSVVIDEGSEERRLLSLEESISSLDPDILLTANGDTFALPYLAGRASLARVELRIGRDGRALNPPRFQGHSYFSYGRILYRASSVRLGGRIHIDESNTFIYSDSSLPGLYEVSRTCRMPLHDGARASIGRCMSSLQFYNAFKRNILVPFRATRGEHFKNANELITADRGGFVFEPRLGLHEDIGEVDYSSLYPSIMRKFNVSGETVLCECCPNSPVKIPELNYNMCVRKQGIVPASLEVLLERKKHYKALKSTSTGEARDVYDSRQKALKWVLVTSFGYLGYRGAKFGRIDSHIAVCAFARKILLESMRIAEENGFSVVHGIVDSLWLKGHGATERDYASLCLELKRRTGFDIAFEGIYRWIAFLPSKADPMVPVLNRYFGVFRSGELKIRGVEIRRRDTPTLVAKCQHDMIVALSKGENLKEARALVPEAIIVLRKYIGAVRDGLIPVDALTIERHVSKSYEDYKNQTPQTSALRRLRDEGFDLKPGQAVRYLVSSEKNRDAIPQELIQEAEPYDADFYVKLLIRAAHNVLEVFGWTEEAIRRSCGEPVQTPRRARGRPVTVTVRGPMSTVSSLDGVQQTL